MIRFDSYNKKMEMEDISYYSFDKLHNSLKMSLNFEI